MVKLRITNLDDLWYLTQIIEPGDVVSGVTMRKVKIGQEDNAKMVKKTMFLTITAETIEFSAMGNALRVNGKVKEGTEEVAQGSYHALELEQNSDITLQKETWLAYQKQKLEEAVEQQEQYLLCLLERDEALFAVSKRSGYTILTKMQGDVPKKGQITEIKKDFYQELSKVLSDYFERHQPAVVIIASPAFYKEELLKALPPDVKRKSVLSTCFDVSERALDEVLKRPELQEVLQKSHARQEQLLVEELLGEIHKRGLCSYGWKEVQQAGEQGAVRALLTTDTFIQEQRQSGNFKAVDALFKLVDSRGGKIHLLAATQEGGRKLNGLGGIAALLRYKMVF